MKGQLTPSQGYVSLGRVIPPLAGLLLNSKRKNANQDSKYNLEEKREKKKNVETASISLLRIKSPLVRVTAPLAGLQLKSKKKNAN